MANTSLPHARELRIPSPSGSLSHIAFLDALEEPIPPSHLRLFQGSQKSFGLLLGQCKGPEIFHGRQTQI